VHSGHRGVGCCRLSNFRDGSQESNPWTSATYSINFPAANFTLSLSSPSITAASGHSAGTTITVCPVNGFRQAVAFTYSGFPADASCSFSPTTVNPSVVSATTTLTIALDSG
jgi:hypothetical protein